jgi:thioredoxin reductase
MTDIGVEYDVAVVGAGPAGLAAATICARAKLKTVLFDEQPSPGGQIYRAITTTPARRDTIFGPDYWSGAGIAQAFLASGADYVPGATVWSISREREIAVSVDGSAHIIQTRRIILATGALERPFPIPGWTLPGVMTAGACQIMLKSAALAPEGCTVLAGCGPLMWLIAWQLLNAGVRVDALLDTTPRENRWAAMRHAASFITSPYVAKGLQLLMAVRRKMRVISGVTTLRAEGESRVERVVYRCDGPEQQLTLDNLFLHQGVVPNVNLAMSIGIAHQWDEAQLCWNPVVDESGSTNIAGIAIAGDGAGIAGAEAAHARGELAGLTAVEALTPGALRDGLPQIASVRARLRRATRRRAFLDALYRPADEFRIPAGDTMVCRCEEVRAQQIVDTVALGCTGPNQMKSFLRCGMGPCQGRLCGLTVTELMARTRGVPPAEIGYYRLRPPVKPITLAELARLPKNEAAMRSVARS